MFLGHPMNRRTMGEAAVDWMTRARLRETRVL
jgi:hypothetical protein